MRLGNHAEADQAAAYIGRQHKFVLSQRTATLGGNQTLTRTDTDGYGATDTSSRSWREFHLGPGSRSRGTSTSRNWSTAQSRADGTSWSDATSTQRVYEYAVEPAVLQNLPENALLLVGRNTASPLQPVACHPEIITLPGVTTPLGAAAPFLHTVDTPGTSWPQIAPGHRQPQWPQQSS